MRYSIDFCNVETGQLKTLSVVLRPEEVAALRAHPFPDLACTARALQIGYQEAGPGFLHLGPEGIRQAQVH
jgi:hypothetical protein